MNGKILWQYCLQFVKYELDFSVLNIAWQWQIRFDEWQGSAQRKFIQITTTTTTQIQHHTIVKCKAWVGQTKVTRVIPIQSSDNCYKKQQTVARATFCPWWARTVKTMLLFKPGSEARDSVRQTLIDGGIIQFKILFASKIIFSWKIIVKCSTLKVNCLIKMISQGPQKVKYYDNYYDNLIPLFYMKVWIYTNENLFSHCYSAQNAIQFYALLNVSTALSYNIY